MTGIRERKKLATRIALSDAALELAAERGVGGVTVEAIADRGGVSVRTFFNYFSTKEEAVVASHRAEISRLVEQIVLRPEDEPIMESLRLAALAFAVPSNARLTRVRRLLHEVDSAPELLPYRLTALAEVERQLAVVIAGRTGRSLSADGYSSLLAATAIAVISTVIRDWRASPSGEPLPERIERAFAQLSTGFAVPLGRPGATAGR